MTRRTTGKTAVSISLELQKSLLDALAAGDDDLLFRTVSRQADDAAPYQFVSEEAPRLSSHARGRPAFSELMFIPVIERTQGAVIGNPGAWAAAERCLSDALDEWLPRGVRKTVFRGIRPYEWIAAWGPSILRKHLLAATPGGVADKCSFSAEKIPLPNDAPRLGFIVMAVTSGTGWLKPPFPDPLRDARFRSVVAHAVNGVSALTPPTVLAPRQMRFAIAEGLCRWLSELHQIAPLGEWSIDPVRGDSDCAEISFPFPCEKGGRMQLGVRRHQLGSAGIHGIVSRLGRYGREMRPLRQ